MSGVVAAMQFDMAPPFFCQSSQRQLEILVNASFFLLEASALKTNDRTPIEIKNAQRDSRAYLWALVKKSI
jgi:hypothetical protein